MRALLLSLALSPVLAPSAAFACAMPYERMMVADAQAKPVKPANLEQVLADIDAAVVPAAVVAPTQAATQNVAPTQRAVPVAAPSKSAPRTAKTAAIADSQSVIPEVAAAGS